MTFWAERAWVSAASGSGSHGEQRNQHSRGSRGSGLELAERVRIETSGGAITAVRTGVGPEPADVRLPGVVFPGFANAHSHAFHRALRGRTHGDGGTFWTWRDSMYTVAQGLTPESYHRLARTVYREMVLAGATVVGEFHYLHHAPDGSPYADPNEMGLALIQAAADAGIRLTLVDTCYLQGGIRTPLAGPQRRFGDGTAERWAERVQRLKDVVAAPMGTVDDQPARHHRGTTPDVLVGAAVHSVRAVPETAIGTVAAWSESAHAPLHVHLSEQPAENDACLAEYGRTPARVLADAGALGPGTTAVHATHLSEEDIQLLGSTGTAVCACPTTEQDLADGISPMGALDAAGSTVCLGSDQHAVIDLLTEARLLEMHERLATGRRGRFSPAELVATLTARGHTALGWPANGRIAVGAAADLVAVRTDTVRTAGADPAQLVLTASSADVATVVVGGRIVVDGGEHRLLPHDHQSPALPLTGTTVDDHVCGGKGAQR
ncbi:formimidoylglutamate deiminase [Phytoactinopolyspora halotolerans]|uniref:Formimidoylglutamate deiminase n=1 Tax=Phytoactinopolyspora halotolerans TaxID=1981512 RepID=A0A6L9SEB0_9ACTN|nr:formimidoylglutamate deiminase [Phytoactinopolyspora halotolerans]